jgi:hypothetical protein
LIELGIPIKTSQTEKSNMFEMIIHLILILGGLSMLVLRRNSISCKNSIVFSEFYFTSLFKLSSWA